MLIGAQPQKAIPSPSGAAWKGSRYPCNRKTCRPAGAGKESSQAGFYNHAAPNGAIRFPDTPAYATFFNLEP